MVQRIAAMFYILLTPPDCALPEFDSRQSFVLSHPLL